MFESKYSKLLTGLLIAGIVIIIGVIAFFGFSIIRNSNIKRDAEEAVEQFQGEIKNTIKEDNDNNTELGNAIAPEIGIENIIVSDNNSNSDNTKLYKGYPMVGTIEIPKTNIKYPVLANASTPAMEVAVCIYDGPGLNQIGNTTIAGHNYRDGRFFSDNKKIENGDIIYITDNSGKKVTYVVYNTYTTSPEDGEYLTRDTQGKREISLTTCTDDSKSRLIIWAKEQ